jgi:hypothetical protein
MIEQQIPFILFTDELTAVQVVWLVSLRRLHHLPDVFFDQLFSPVDDLEN